MSDPEDLPPTANEGVDPAEADPIDPYDVPDDGQAMGMPREKAIRIAQIGLVVLAILVVGIVFLTKGGDDDSSSKDKETTEGGTDDKAPAKAEWPKNVGGRPPALGTRGQTAPEVTLGEGAKPGVYLWNDYDGWHLWVVNGTGLPAVSGTITSNDEVAKATSAVPGAGTVTVASKVVTFDLPTDQPLVGVDFNPGFFAKNLVFTLDGPDGPIAETMVFVGAKSDPAPYPLVLVKAAP